MMKKEDILNNPNQYSAAEFFEAIKGGVVTYKELCDNPNNPLAIGTRKELKNMLQQGDDDEWEKAKKANTLEAVENYLRAYPEGKFVTEANNLKKRLEAEASIKQAWEQVDKKNQAALEKFIEQYPDSEYATVARQKINALCMSAIQGSPAKQLVNSIRRIQANADLNATQKATKIVGKVTGFVTSGAEKKKDFLEVLQQDHNLLNAWDVKQLIEKDAISWKDLIGIGIDSGFLGIMQENSDNPNPPAFQYQPFDKINKQSTEVYFWGVPSSGKSCALGAILSAAYSGGIATMLKDTASQGYGYMDYLANMFQSGKVRELPESTSLFSFWEMGFDLVERNGKTHPITCIDMAGELMRCMYKYNASRVGNLNPDEVQMLNTMNNVLIANRSVNRKMHFFVIEYGAENRLYEGITQQTYLDGAMNYIRDTKIFAKNTDAIFILITKTDKAKDQSPTALRQYIKNNYKGFYNGLKLICEQNEINKGEVEMMAFTLGEVCFQQYCKFDPKPAENVVRQILEHSAFDKKGLCQKFLKLFKG